MNTSNSSHIPAAVAMVRMLRLYGVDNIFGLCGDTSLPFYDALRAEPKGLRHYLCRDERSAAYMADAYARISNKVGVCEGPSGGGATYMVPGLVEANESSIPVLALTSDVATSSQGKYPLTELDQPALFRPLTKWNATIDRGAHLPQLVRQAFRCMTTGVPGSAHLAFPIDVQRELVAAEQLWAQSQHASYPAWRAGVDEQAADALTEALLSAQAPVIICGGGVVSAAAEAELARLATSLNIAVATSISGKGALSEQHPLCLGVVGSNGGVAATRELVAEADLVLFIGCRAGSVTTEKWQFPRAGTRILHIDANPQAIGACYHTEQALVADARLALAAINERLVRLPQLPDFGGAEAVRSALRQKFAAFAELAKRQDFPIKPEQSLAALQELLPDDAIVVADAGTPCPYVSAYYRCPLPGRSFISNRAHGALGYALAAAVGAHVARPQVKTVALMGDGSFGFTAGELETVARYQLPICCIVFNNSTYGWIKAGQKSSFDRRYFGVDFSPGDHAAIANAFGIRSWRVDSAEQLVPALRAALEHSEPSFVDMTSQPLHEARAPVSEWIA